MTTRRTFLRLLGLAPVAAPVVAAEAMGFAATGRPMVLTGIPVFDPRAFKAVLAANPPRWRKFQFADGPIREWHPPKQEIRALLHSQPDPPLPCADDCSVTCWDDCLDAQAMRAVEGRAGNGPGEVPAGQPVGAPFAGTRNATQHDAGVVRGGDVAGNRISRETVP